ncbi:tripartite tricarboxylate transporter substrate binding protein [Hoeflea sp. WL0058]|uniref:Tripartite tricarboxylate transporter substrate binding protein n=1 Tax=Flavimaribacter sediminis TaxID=2865987 RepID=A0AAE2ZRK8_9HYPH|nr:tripartite tricarboxylate transporter substrate binding protein [Flavimaribacter sediminis]MBW8639178.1 tripartite tricarboxylate transporter substrate binding protein [Flavimaribacter sediminis]
MLSLLFKKTGRFIGAIALSFTLYTATANSGMAWEPDGPIRLIVPWNAGGGTDLLARALAASAEDEFGVPVVVENVPGAFGALGAQRVARSDPNGQTLLVSSQFLAWIDQVREYPVTLDDLSIVMSLNSGPAAFAVSADSGIESLEDLKRVSNEMDGGFTVAHAGEGLIWHISALLLANKLGVEWNLVPFDGTNAGVAGVLGGQVNAVSGGAAEFVSQANGGGLRVLGVFSDEESFDALPEAPTSASLDLDYQMITSRGLAGPAGLSDETLNALYEGFTKAAQKPEFVAQMNKLGLGIDLMPPAEYQTFMDNMRSSALSALSNASK